MKTLSLLVFFALLSAVGLAQEPFPGLKQLLSDSEWKRARLDRLSPDEIGVIDAAIIRHYGQAATQHQQELAEARAATATATAAAQPEKKRGLFERFGLPAFDESDWRDMPPLKATVVAWVSANRFKLDNGQIWEGFEAIPYDLVGKTIEIAARPRGQFAIVLDGKPTTSRVMRLR
ncbi:MAG: hypothetical protein ABIZ04_08120 [Opitutus sp.]